MFQSIRLKPLSSSPCLQCNQPVLTCLPCYQLGSSVLFSQKTAPQHTARHRTAAKLPTSVRPQPQEADIHRPVMDMLLRSLVKRHNDLRVAVGLAAKTSAMPAIRNTDVRITSTADLICAIQQAPNSASHKDFFEQIKTQLIKRVYTTPLAVSLQACYSFYAKEQSLTQYLSVLFSVTDEIFDKLSPSPSEITQLFLYIFSHGSAPQMLFYKVEEYLLMNLDKFDIGDLGVICGGFFRANARIISQDLIDAIAVKLLRKIDALEPFLLPNFLKMFRHSGYIRVSFYEKLADHIVSTDFLSKYRSVNPLMHLAFTYASLTIQHEKLFDQLLSGFERLVSGPRKVRTKDISKFVWACGTLQFRPDNYHDRYGRLVEAFRADSRDRTYLESLGELLVGLAYLEIFPEDLLSKCLAPAIATQLMDSGSDKEKGMQLILLHETVKIECPRYTGNMLSQTHVEKMLHHPLVSHDLSHQLKVRVGLAAILSMLCERLGAGRVYCHYPLPHFNSPVIELHFCSVDGFVRFSPKPADANIGNTFTQRAITDHLFSLLSKQPLKPAVDAQVTRVGVVVAGNHQHSLNSSQALGHWSTKLRQLSKLGYVVCQVSSDVATEMEWSTQEERGRLLSALISSCLQTEIRL